MDDLLPHLRRMGQHLSDNGDLVNLVIRSQREMMVLTVIAAVRSLGAEAHASLSAFLSFVLAAGGPLRPQVVVQIIGIYQDGVKQLHKAADAMSDSVRENTETDAWTENNTFPETLSRVMRDTTTRMAKVVVVATTERLEAESRERREPGGDSPHDTAPGPGRS